MALVPTRLNVFIVGYTGTRAPAISTCRDGAPRLLAPVGSNASESGRALNRRVELVAP